MEAWKEWLRPELIWFFIGLLLLFVELVVPGLVIAFFAFGAWVVAAVHLFTAAEPEPAVGPVHHGLGALAGAGAKLAQEHVHRLRQLPQRRERGPGRVRRAAGDGDPEDIAQAPRAGGVSWNHLAGRGR